MNQRGQTGMKAEMSVLTGTCRVDRRTKTLVRRIKPGEIAVIDHRDLDRVAAEGLVEAGVAAVINAAPSISGRYPNQGPIVLLRGGVSLVDGVGPELLDALRDGDGVRVEGGEIWRGEHLVGNGVRQSLELVTEAMATAHSAIGDELELFAENTLEYIRREARLFFEPLELPALRTKFEGRHALVVVRGHDFKNDLRTLRPYIREFQPVLIAVDGGADALLDIGFTPDIITGDFDSLTERAVRCGAELIHHVHPDGRAPGREELLAWGVEYQEFVAEGMSEDVAMLLAYEAGASLIVAVGTHATMVEFLDKGRKGMASTFLTRLRLGPVLVDAKGVNRLYESRVRRRDVVWLVLSAFVAVLMIVLVSESLQVFLDGVKVTLRDLWFSITDSF
ncbi:MAG TPA: putative cytokinetic ring protein SteA [Acidimicrobiia bacterium]|nr:putative cytokinetic ring protein SteA [Acidimicrobiia bacterium]